MRGSVVQEVTSIYACHASSPLKRTKQANAEVLRVIPIVMWFVADAASSIANVKNAWCPLGL